MVAQHYRWDFYGLSTDSKPTATDPKVANGSTYYEADTSKLYVWYNDQWYEKEAGGGELPIASAETLGGVKVGDGLSITEGGVLSASGGGGEAGAFKELTSADYNYPADNPTDIAVWLLPRGLYYVTNSNMTIRLSSSSYFTYGSTFMVTDIPSDNVNRYIYCFGNPEGSGPTGNYGFQMYKVNATNGSQNFRGGFDLHTA